MKSEAVYSFSSEQNRWGETLHPAGKAHEDQCAAERNGELLRRIKRRKFQQHDAPRHSERRVFSRILCPIDFGETSLAGFELAARLAVHHGAAVYLLHVTTPNAIGWAMHEGESAKREIAKLRELAARNGTGLRSQCIAGVGEPAAEIVRVAKTINADLVVIGTSAEPTIIRLLVGSVAERVLEQSSCPVLVVLCKGDRN